MSRVFSKSVKMLILTLMSVIIIAVSAETYRYMYIDGSVTVGASKLIWIKGDDAPSDATISGSTVTMDLDVEPGTPQNFTYCLYLKNQDTAAHNMTISVTTIITASDFDVCKIHIYENATIPGTWTFVDTIDVETSDSYETYTGNDPLGADEYYLMTFEVAATTSATGTYDFDIQMEYE